jgi:acyl carrier protein
MERNEVVAEIFRLIKEFVPEYDGAHDDSIDFAEAGVDSLTKVDVVVAAESAFNIEIPDSVMPKLATIEALTDYVLENAQAGAAR